ncbi:MAG: hypothetical protein HFJ50_00220 [Clostridia bacterium]|jgi:hypothetical protein|nr:hypothetical protein [Clostridia bacterium]
MLYGKKKGATAFEELVEIKDVPESGSDPEQIDVTTLKRKIKSYVAGRQDSTLQSFTYNYTEENYFTKVMPYCNGEIHEFLVVFQDETGTLIEGSATTRKNAVSLNSAVEATLAITPQNIVDKNSTEVSALLPTSGN